MKQLRANIRGFLFYLFMVVGLFTIVPPWILFCLALGKRNRLMLIAKPFFNVMFFLFGVKVKIEGDLPEQGKMCFVLCNHQSFIDVPVIMCKTFPVAFLAKKSLFKIPYFGLVLKSTNSIPVERGNPQTNIELPDQIRSRLSQSFPIMAFPEGTRSKNGELLPFKNGIFRMIKEVEAPVLPITIVNAWRIMPLKGIALYPGEIKIIPHKIIPVEQVEKLTYIELKDMVRDIIKGMMING